MHVALDHADPIFGVFAAAPADKPFVVAQLGQSLDGRIATATGASHWINGPAALDHLHRLRAHVDAVVVGINTIVADDPLLNVRRANGENPVRVIIDPSGRLPDTARCLKADARPTLVARAGDIPTPEGAEALILPAPGGHIAPAALLDALFARGLRRILVEGGARTVSGFIDAGCVDRLHVTVATLIIGSGKSGLDLRPVPDLARALRPATRIHLLGARDVLFDCDLRTTADDTGH